MSIGAGDGVGGGVGAIGVVGAGEGALTAMSVAAAPSMTPKLTTMPSPSSGMISQSFALLLQLNDFTRISFCP